MTDIQNTVEKALAVGVSSALVSGVGSLIPKHGVSSLLKYLIMYILSLLLVQLEVQLVHMFGILSENNQILIKLK